MSETESEKRDEREEGDSEMRGRDSEKRGSERKGIDREKRGIVRGDRREGDREGQRDERETK